MFEALFAANEAEFRRSLGSGQQQHCGLAPRGGRPASLHHLNGPGNDLMRLHLSGPCCQ